MKIFPGSIMLILLAQKSVVVLEYFIELAIYLTNIYGNNFSFLL